MPERKKLSESEIKTAVKRKLDRALTFHNDPLSRDRMKALQYYRGDKFGNEQEGLSQVVSRDVAEVVDTLLPSLMRPFTSGDRTVLFEPMSEEDREQAEQATAMVNHIMTVDNPGFQIYHSWFKDALLQRNGIVKTWWETVDRSAVDKYQGLTDAQLEALLAPDAGEIEVLEQADVPGLDETGQPVEFHNVVIRRTWEDGKNCVRNVPPEEFIIDLDVPILDRDTPFCAHRFRKTISDLIDEGFNREKVESIPDAGDSIDGDREAAERQKPEGVDSRYDEEPADPSMREVWVAECYVKIDVDGDGTAELRKITLGGDECDVILDNAEVDDNPFASITPYPMSHKFYGESLADKTVDVQELKSAVWRQTMNNLYLTNNPQKEVVDGQVNMDDLLTPRIGGFIRVKALGQVREIPPQTVYQHGLKALEYIDSVREKRTGVTAYNQGLDADTLNKTATGINAIMGAANLRQELIARVFAETGVTRLFKLILKNSIKYQDRPRTIRMRNKYVEIDPKYWNADMDVTVSVGLGTGNKDQRLAHANNLLLIQEKIIASQGGISGPLVTGENAFNALDMYVQAADLKKTELYFTDPANSPPQEPKPDPKMVEAQTDAEIAKGKAVAEGQLAQQKAQADAETERQKAANQLQLDMQRMQAEIGLAREKAMAEIEIARMKAMADVEMSRERMGADMAMKGERHRFDMAQPSDTA